MTEVKTSASEENTLSAKGYKLLKFLGEGAYAKVYNLNLFKTCYVIPTAMRKRTARVQVNARGLCEETHRVTSTLHTH